MAVNNVMLQFKRRTDRDAFMEVDKRDKLECGAPTLLPRVHILDVTTGMHNSRGRGCSLRHDQYWIKHEGAKSKAASAAPPSRIGSTSVSGLTQQLEQMSVGNTGMGHVPENASAECQPISLTHEEVSYEAYTGNAFPHLELVSDDRRHHDTASLQSLGTFLHWSLNQEIVFSAALTGKPLRKEAFTQYCWKRCVVGTSTDYAMAISRDDWERALPMVICGI